MKKTINIGTFRSKRLDVLTKQLTPTVHDERKGEEVRSLLRHSMKSMNNSHVLESSSSKTRTSSAEQPHSRLIKLSPSQASQFNSQARGHSGFKHVRSNSSRPDCYAETRESKNNRYMKETTFSARLMSPTTSSLKKINKLQGPAKLYVRNSNPTPSPGDYHQELSIGGCSYRIGTAKRVRHRTQSSVGPGAYNNPAPPAGVSYSMTPKRKPGKPEQLVLHFPGPGTYTPRTLEEGTKFSVGRADRTRSRCSDSPGPATYSVSRPDSSRSRSALTVKSTRPPLSQVLDTPGPGTYHKDLSIGGPELSMRTKLAFVSANLEPGPGAYSPAVVSPASPAWRFGSSKKRLELNDYSVPEPAWYNRPSTTTRKQH